MPLCYAVVVGSLGVCGWNCGTADAKSEPVLDSARLGPFKVHIYGERFARGVGSRSETANDSRYLVCHALSKFNRTVRDGPWRIFSVFIRQMLSQQPQCYTLCRYTACTKGCLGVVFMLQ